MQWKLGRSRTGLQVSDKGVRDAVVFDIDGVLCHNQELLHEFLETNPTPERWRDEWFAFIDQHPSNEAWVQLLRMLYGSGYTIILLTARPENKREDTDRWLELNDIAYDRLVMRPEYCEYKDCKRIALIDLAKEYNLCLAIDDDEIQVAVFKEQGIPTVHAFNGVRAS